MRAIIKRESTCEIIPDIHYWSRCYSNDTDNETCETTKEYMRYQENYILLFKTHSK